MAADAKAPGRRRAMESACAALALLSGHAGGQTAQRATGADRMRTWTRPLKGFNIGTLKPQRHDHAYFQQVALTRARLVRLFVEFAWDAGRGRYVLPASTQRALALALSSLEWTGLQLVLVGDFEAAPNPPLWGDAGRAAAFVDAWQRLARLLRDEACVVGLDLLNEPNPPWSDGTQASARAEWRALAATTIEAIRREDAAVPIVFEGIGGGQVVGLKQLLPFDDPHLVYSLHFYTPHAITHQHVGARWNRTLPYPVRDNALLHGTEAYPGPWDAARLRAEMHDAAEFHRLSGAPIFVGEFSCVRWAPGVSAATYLRDCIEIFNSHGWSWAYHEFRGWPGWDAEVASNDRAVNTRSARSPIIRMLRQEMVASNPVT